MKVTIIHKEDCPLCERAIDEFTKDGHEVFLYESMSELFKANSDRASSMMAEMQWLGVDIDKLPLVFIHDRFIPWEPK